MYSIHYSVLTRLDKSFLILQPLPAYQQVPSSAQFLYEKAGVGAGGVQYTVARISLGGGRVMLDGVVLDRIGVKVRDEGELGRVNVRGMAEKQDDILHLSLSQRWEASHMTLSSFSQGLLRHDWTTASLSGAANNPAIDGDASNVFQFDQAFSDYTGPSSGDVNLDWNLENSQRHEDLARAAIRPESRQISSSTLLHGQPAIYDHPASAVGSGCATGTSEYNSQRHEDLSVVEANQQTSHRLSAQPYDQRLVIYDHSIQQMMQAGSSGTSTDDVNLKTQAGGSGYIGASADGADLGYNWKGTQRHEGLLIVEGQQTNRSGAPPYGQKPVIYNQSKGSQQHGEHSNRVWNGQTANSSALFHDGQPPKSAIYNHLDQQKAQVRSSNMLQEVSSRTMTLGGWKCKDLGEPWTYTLQLPSYLSDDGTIVEQWLLGHKDLEVSGESGEWEMRKWGQSLKMV
ncbi:hypothetical protein BDN67DRAFT_986111 [Paxillus ammoniavirescens]|nr:hypothetical protein BDN67DRAFT_986111 [Paxillus ammoniavirescens]